jgi:colanic acid/amylovoran biosynthesis glycosyltransferase
MNPAKITVLHSTPRWLPQTETWLYNQVRYLPAEVDNHIVCDTVENLDQFWLPNIHSLSDAPRWRYFWDKGLRKLRVRRHLGLLARVTGQQEANILHSHYGPTGWINMGAASRTGARHLVTFYGHDVNYLPRQDPRWRERYRALFERVDGILCEGPYMAGCVAELGCPEHKIRVHHLGVDIQGIAFQPRIWDSTSTLRVLIASSFREKKGIPYALEALGLIRQDVSLEITIIGDANGEARNQAEKRKILDVVERHGLRSNVRMLGYQPHAVLLEEAYRHHVFLSPSVHASDGDTEGGAPVSIIEMAASGMPIVSTHHCDIPEVVKDGVTGLLADERDVEGLALRLRWLIEHPNKWDDMLKAGRKHVEMEYGARTQGEKLMKVYEEVLNESQVLS